MGAHGGPVDPPSVGTRVARGAVSLARGLTSSMRFFGKRQPTRKKAPNGISSIAIARGKYGKSAIVSRPPPPISTSTTKVPSLRKKEPTPGGQWETSRR